MKQCKCGNDCADNARFCPKCGYRFTSTLTKLVLAVIVLFFLFGIFGQAILRDSGSSYSASSSSSTSSATAADPKDVLLSEVKLNFQWSTTAGGNIMMADFTVNNPTPYRFKDIEITCEHLSPSGTNIDSNTRTIYQIVEPKSKKVIKQMNMGFIHSQATKSGCRITDLVVL